MDPEIKNISSNTEKKQAQVAKYTAKEAYSPRSSGSQNIFCSYIRHCIRKTMKQRKTASKM